MPPLDHTKCYLTAKSTLGTFIHIFRGKIDCFNCFAVREIGSISVCLGPNVETWKSTPEWSCLFCGIKFTMARYLNWWANTVASLIALVVLQPQRSTPAPPVQGPCPTTSNYFQTVQTWGLFAVGRLLIKPNHLSHHLISKWTCGNVYSSLFWPLWLRPV